MYLDFSVCNISVINFNEVWIILISNMIIKKTNTTSYYVLVLCGLKFKILTLLQYCTIYIVVYLSPLTWEGDVNYLKSKSLNIKK